MHRHWARDIQRIEVHVGKDFADGFFTHLYSTKRKKDDDNEDNAFPDIPAHKFNTLLSFDRTDNSLGRLLFSSFQWQATIINR